MEAAQFLPATAQLAITSTPSTLAHSASPLAIPAFREAPADAAAASADTPSAMESAFRTAIQTHSIMPTPPASCAALSSPTVSPAPAAAVSPAQPITPLPTAAAPSLVPPPLSWPTETVPLARSIA